MTQNFITKHLKFLLTVFLISYLAIGDVSAQILLPGIASQDQISRIQNREIERQKIKIEQENAKKKKLFLPKKIVKKIALRKKDLPCFKIKKFEFSENKIISQKELQKISSKHLDQCFNLEIISQIKNDIYATLSNEGYITSQALFPKQNISDGIVEIKITHGKIKRIVLSDEKISDKVQKFFLFGDLSEDILNINIFNQGLFQMNKLPSNNSKIKIIPSDEDGYSDVVINNESTSPFRANISHDNLGNDFTGVKRTTFATSADNLLSMSEMIDLSFTNNLNDSNSKKEMESVTASIAIPFRYYTLSYNYSDTSYMGKVLDDNGIYTLNGFSRRKSLTLDRSLANKERYSINISSSLTLKNTGSESLLIDLVNKNEKKLSIMDFSLSASGSFDDNFNVYVKSTILQGLSSFGANRDSPKDPSNQAKYQFRAYKLFLNLSKSIRLDSLNSFITLSSEIDSQISQDTLHGSEQFSVGGYYSVRGFRENYISGDHGYYIRNKINANFESLLSSFVDSGSFTSKLRQISFEPFFDYGYTKDKESPASGRLSGAGIKTTFDSRYFDASITYSRSLGKSQLISGNKKEDQIIYFSLSTKY